MREIIRCGWADTGPLEQVYHDTVWGIPEHDDRTLFKMLILEGMQAGLSWSTILKKMDTLCAAFDGFDPECVACYDERKIEALLGDPGIIRNRRKVEAAIRNARAYIALKEQYGSLDAFLWAYVGGEPIQGRRASMSEVPSSTELSNQISKDLKKLGFGFVGSTIVYAFMQAVGMVNDHLVTCAFYSYSAPK